MEQGCSLGLDCLSLETVLRRFLDRSHLNAVTPVSRSRLGLETLTSRLIIIIYNLGTEKDECLSTGILSKPSKPTQPSHTCIVRCNEY